jgi:pimeloyl-ACP methyl ester carboxylesterase
MPIAAVQRSFAAVLASFTALTVSGCQHADTPAPPHGPVDIGSGRTLFLDCQGDGSPTVLIIPGKGSYAEAWNVVVPPDDPIRASPYDVIEQAALTPSPDAVQPTVARTTRVCAYDRPNTRPDGVDQSTPVPQPHTVAADVDDLVALIAAAHLAGPVVVVAHSYGGLIADLLARTHPELVSALVMVDPVSEFLPAVGTPAQNAAFDRDGRVPATPDGEGVLFDDAFARITAAPPLPKVPAAVLSSGKFMPAEKLTADNYTQAQIHRSNDMLAAELGTDNRVVTDSGHNVMLYSPREVAQVIDGIVAKVG